MVRSYKKGNMKGTNKNEPDRELERKRNRNRKTYTEFR